MYHRHDISDNLWNFLSGGDGSVGREAKDNRRFINGVFWIFRTGAPWRDLPPDYGDWKTRIVDFVVGETGELGRNCWN